MSETRLESTTMTPEQETLRLAQAHFAEWRFPDVDIRLERGSERSLLVVTFVLRDRPGCRFGYTWHLPGDDAWAFENNPVEHVGVLSANFQEDLHDLRPTLPTDCRPGEVVWLSYEAYSPPSNDQQCT